MPAFRFDPYQPGAFDPALLTAEARARAQAIRQQGQAEAENAIAGGQAASQIAGSLAQLGGLPMQIQQQKAAQVAAALDTKAKQVGIQAQTAQLAKLEREAKEDAALQAVLMNPKAQPEDILKASPTKGVDILKGLEAIKESQRKDFVWTRERLADLTGGLLATPEAMRGDAYQGLRQHYVAQGQLKPEDLPEQFNQAWLESTHASLLSPDKQQDILNPKPIEVTAGASLFDPKSKTSIFTAPSKAPDINAGSLEDYVLKTYGPNATGEQIIKARNEYEQAGREPDVAVELSPEGLKIAAHQYAMTGQLPPMGMGKQGASVRTKIINEAAKVYKDLDLPSQIAAWNANKASLTKMQSQLDAITAFENTAVKNLDQFIQQAKTIVDTGSPLLNRPLRTFNEAVLGDPKMAAVRTARTVMLPEFARIITNPNLTGVLSDSARKEVDSLIKGEATLKQALAAATILKQDAENRRTSIAQQIQDIRTRIATPPTGAGTTPPSAPAIEPPAKLPPGATVTRGAR